MVSRNKLAFGAVAAVALAILVGLGLATVGFIRASAALAEAKEQRALADDNFREARAAVEDLLRICDQRLKDQPGLEPLRIELMKAAIDRYEPFLAKPIADPTPREELARLHAQYGLLIQESNADSTALQANTEAEFEKARTIQEQLLQEHPGDRALRCDLGWTLNLEEWSPNDEAPSAEQAGLRAVAMFRQLVAENPADPFARDELVWATWLYTRLHRDSNDPAVSTIANEGLAVGEQLVRDYPASVEFRRDLANALVINEVRAMKTNPTAAEAERRCWSTTGYCRCVRPSWPIFSPIVRRPSSRNARLTPRRTWSFPAFFMANATLGGHTTWPMRRIARCTIGTTWRPFTINPQ